MAPKPPHPTNSPKHHFFLARSVKTVPGGNLTIPRGLRGFFFTGTGPLAAGAFFFPSLGFEELILRQLSLWVCQ